ncbi:MAG: sulfatase [Paenibacillaceae bacterium]|nr:sulfatase [Paenibacillaceae bacterium]
MMRNERYSWAKKVTISVALAVSLGWGVFSANPAEAAGEKPNVVLIVVDDMGYGDTTMTYPNALWDTPNIDSIAQDGVLFANGYTASPVCSPSRAALLTGQYPASFGADSNDLSREHPGKVPAQTIASLLAAKGYTASMASGKWDLAGRSGNFAAPEDQDPYMPIARGFTDFYGIPGGISSYYKTDGTAPGGAWYLNGSGVATHDCTSSGCNIVSNWPRVLKTYDASASPSKYVKITDDNVYLTDVFSREAVNFIDSHGKDQDVYPDRSPFFLYLSYNATHVPYQAPDEHYQNILDDPSLSGLPDNQKMYLAMIDALDEQVGRVLNKLDAMNISDETMVIFVSDNGPAAAGSAGGLAGGKYTLQEGGIHMPFAVKWPNKYTNPGMVFTPPVSTLDVLSTIAVAAGYSLDNLKSSYGLDGENLTPYILGTSTGDPHDALYWRYIDDHSNSDKFAVRSGSNKYLKTFNQDGTIDESLYDLQNDLGETTNLIADPSKSAVLSDLIGKLHSWNKSNSFSAKFGDGRDYGWVKFGGTWTLDNDQYKAVGNNGAKSAAGIAYYEDMTYEADITPTQSGKAGLFFRASDYGTGAYAFHGYLAQFETGNDQLELIRMDNGSKFTIQTAGNIPISLNQTYHMKIVASGSNIKVYLGDMTTAKINVNDSTYTGGGIGLRVTGPNSQNDTTVLFDNVSAHE